MNGRSRRANGRGTWRPCLWAKSVCSSEIFCSRSSPSAMKYSVRLMRRSMLVRLRKGHRSTLAVRHIFFRVVTPTCSFWAAAYRNCMHFSLCYHVSKMSDTRNAKSLAIHEVTCPDQQHCSSSSYSRLYSMSHTPPFLHQIKGTKRCLYQVNM